MIIIPFEVKNMFRDTRKKKLRRRVIFTAICVFVLTFGIWLNYKPDNSTQNTAKKISVEETKKIEETEKNETDTKTPKETYLIKEVNGVVKVFLCEGKNKKELYLITSIPFELLSESDQELLKGGVSIESEEELGRFLENFDS
ncbi:MAG: hypothetical protein GX663_08430 [Clostridiales bacterium]|nr:hypothetical protein [Clostridiales bacterium]